MRSSFLLIACAFTLATSVSGQRLKKSAEYFNTPGKVGILVQTVINTDKASSASGFGLIGGVAGAVIGHAKSTDKFDTVLTVLEPRLDPIDTAKAVYQEVYSRKGKTVVMIDDIDPKSFPDFIAPKGTDKKYLRKDVQSLKEKYGVEDLVLIIIDYGIEVHYKYGIETYREGVSSVNTNIISLRDNSFIVNEITPAAVRISGKWNTPPGYENVTAAIQRAIRKSIANDVAKYPLIP